MNAEIIASCDVVIGNHAIMERMFSREGIGSVVDHVLRFMTNSQNAMRAALDGHNGRLVDHDPCPLMPTAVAVPRSIAISYDDDDEALWIKSKRTCVFLTVFIVQLSILS